MTTPAEKRDIRRFRMISVAPTMWLSRAVVVWYLTRQTFQGVRPGAPLLADHVNASGRVAGRVLTAWVDRNAGAVLGTVEIYPDNIEAAAHVRRLLNAGHRGASIRHDGVVEPNPDRVGPNMVRDWGIAHLAVVGEGADPSAGQLSANDGTVYFDLEIMPNTEGDEMTQPNFDLNAALPLLTDAIAAGVRQGRAATDTDEPAADQMSKMLQIAASQPELYDKAGLSELALDAVMGKLTSADDLRNKLTSIHIIPKPIAAGMSDAEVSEYDLNAIMRGVLTGDLSGASKEVSRSDEIKAKSELKGRLSPDAIAIPLDCLASHSGTTGAGASGSAIQEINAMYYDSGVPDSTNVLPMLTRLPDRPGIAKAVAITAPQPGHVPEPGDSGFSKTGDAVGEGFDMHPHLLVDYMALTRVLEVLEPEFEGSVLTVVLNRFMEQMNRGLVVGDTANSPLENGLYGLADVGSSANLAAALTTANVETALATSVHVAGPDAGRAIITTPENVQTLRSLAQPSAVSALMSPTPAMNGEDRIRDARVWTSDFFPDTKTRRGVVGPFSDILIKEWDQSVFVHQHRYEAGVISWLLRREMYWTILGSASRIILSLAPRLAAHPAAGSAPAGGLPTALRSAGVGPFHREVHDAIDT